MTKVDELREVLRKALFDADDEPIVDSLISAARSEGVAEERERIRAACREFKAGDTLIINAPTLLLESSVFHSRRGK